MERLNDEIEKLSAGIKKYQTDFKTKSISINEDTLLAFPRTSTHTSATFGVPSNSKVLRGTYSMRHNNSINIKQLMKITGIISFFHKSSHQFIT